jgi:hypothetical protein
MKFMSVCKKGFDAQDLDDGQFVSDPQGLNRTRFQGVPIKW